MDKNKSIDGLKTRRSKKPVKTSTRTTTRVSSPKTKSTSVKPKTKTTSTKTKASASAVRKTTKKTSKKPVIKTKKVAKPTDIAPAPVADTEDFLSPVQAFDFDEQTGKLVESKQPLDKLKKKAKKKITVGIIAGIGSLLLIALIIFILWINGILANITGGQGNVFDLLFSDNYVELKTDENGRTNILVFGTSGYNMEGDEGDGSVHDGAQLTDTIMVISLNQETGDIAMLSLPRDLKASPTCTATGKINEVYWCNNMEDDNEQAGADALIAEVHDILDVDFQYYVHINWGSLVQIVDALGGIKVTLDEDVHDYYLFDAGVEYHLDGDKALRLARTRYGTANGDFSRGASQQKIIIGIKDRVLEKNLSISELMSLASTLGDNLRTNFSVDELKTVAHLGYEFDLNNMRQVSLIEPNALMTTGSINGISYVLPVGGAGYYDDIKAYVALMFSNDPKDYEEPTVLVLGNSEAATTEQEKLKAAGYETVDIDSAPSTNQDKKYTLFSTTDKKPGTKKLLESKYNTSAKNANDLPAGVSRDYDFILIIGS